MPSWVSDSYGWSTKHGIRPTVCPLTRCARFAASRPVSSPSGCRAVPTPTHTKLGRGGLADIEWTVQLLQLQHAHQVPALHNTSTLQSLDVIAAADLVPAADVELLRQAWLTATRARNALVLVRGKPTDQLPGPGRQLNAVAVAAGWRNDDGGEFLDNYLRVTRRAKAVVRKVFGS